MPLWNMKNNIKISVIICFYERLDYLKCCLDSLLPSSDLFYEVVVTDDGSCADTVSEVKTLITRYPFQIQYAWQPNNGFRVAAARNNGVRHATGDYFIFLDCDFLVLPDTLSIHRKYAKPGRFLSGYCKYLSEPETMQILQKSINQIDLVALYSGLPDDNLKRDHFKFVTRTWRIRMGIASAKKQTLGGHFSIFRNDFESVNGYDEEYVGWGGEDIDLGIRLVTGGIYGRSVIKSARVLHMWHLRETNSHNWRTGTNMPYFNREGIDPVCKIGLRKGLRTTLC